MTWGRNEDGFPQNRKIAPLSDAAFRLYVTARDYANRELTDGFLVGTMVPCLTRAPQATALKRVLRELTDTQPGEDHPLWEVVDGGYRIHDFHDYNPTRLEVEQQRHQRNGGKVAGGKARAANAARAGGRFTSEHQQPPPAATSSPPAGPPAADQQPTSPGPIPSTQETKEPLGKRDPTVITAPRALPAGACRACTEVEKLPEADLNDAWKAHRDVPPHLLEYVARWQRQRGSVPDMRELGRVLDPLFLIHGHPEVRTHFARLTDPDMPVSQQQFHTLRTFGQNFRTYGPTFDPTGAPQKRGQRAVEATDWSQEESDVVIR